MLCFLIIFFISLAVVSTLLIKSSSYSLRWLYRYYSAVFIYRRLISDELLLISNFLSPWLSPKPRISWWVLGIFLELLLTCSLFIFDMDWKILFLYLLSLKKSDGNFWLAILIFLFKGEPFSPSSKRSSLDIGVESISFIIVFDMILWQIILIDKISRISYKCGRKALNRLLIFTKTTYRWFITKKGNTK